MFEPVNPPHSLLFLGLCLCLVTATLPEDDPWAGEVQEDSPSLESVVVVDSQTIPAGDPRGYLRNLVSDPRLLWPDKILYYDFPSRQFSKQLKVKVRDALKDIMRQTCVRFQRRRRQETYLKLRVTGKGCATKVGFHQDEGVQDLHIGGSSCHSRGTIQHEFLHALGFWHEHTRPDRDKFISVNWDHIKTDAKKNFAKRSRHDTLNIGLPYDYASVMHYKQHSFSKDKRSPTLVPKFKEAVKIMGQRRGMSRVDIAKLNRLYNCTGDYYRGKDVERRKVVISEVDGPGASISTNTLGIKLKRNDKIRGRDLKDFGDENNQQTFYEANESDLEILSYLAKERDPDIVSDTGNESGNVQEINPDLLVKHIRMKRNSKTQANSNPKTENEQQMESHQESFTPQKILPELLKGVLNNDNNNDRPIVIQFAIYQPIQVYKSNNNSESSDQQSTDNKSNDMKKVNMNTERKGHERVRDDDNVQFAGSGKDQGYSESGIDIRTADGEHHRSGEDDISSFTRIAKERDRSYQTQSNDEHFKATHSYNPQRHRPSEHVEDSNRKYVNSHAETPESFSSGVPEEDHDIQPLKAHRKGVEQSNDRKVPNFRRQGAIPTRPEMESRIGSSSGEYGSPLDSGTQFTRNVSPSRDSDSAFNRNHQNQQAQSTTANRDCHNCERKSDGYYFVENHSEGITGETKHPENVSPDWNPKLDNDYHQETHGNSDTSPLQETKYHDADSDEEREGEKRRPDIFVEEDFNSELDKEIRRTKLEKMLSKEITSERPTLPPTPARRFVPARTVKDTPGTQRRPANSRLIQPRGTPQNGRKPALDVQQTSNFDRDLLSQSGFSPLNLDPTQILPLNVSSKVSVRSSVSSVTETVTRNSSNRNEH